MSSDLDQGHLWEEENAAERKRRERIVFSIRNLGFVLFDIVPRERRQALMDGLTKLAKRTKMSRAEEFHSIPSGLGGSLGAGWTRNIGQLYVSEFPQFDWIEVSVGQDFDFCYFVTFRSFLRTEYQDKIKDSFVTAGEMIPYDRKTDEGTLERGTVRKGPELEPTIREFQSQLEEFLSEFIPGLYLSRNKETRPVRCPSLRILISNEMALDDFPTWYRNHQEFMMFLSVEVAVSQIGTYLISYQNERLLREAGVFAGLNIICTKPIETATSRGEPESDTFLKASYFFLTELVQLFLVVYWTQFQLDSTLLDWQNKIEPLGKVLDKLLSRRKFPSVKDLMPRYHEVVQLLNEFEDFALDEDRRMQVMQRSSRIATPKKSQPIVVIRGIEIDVIGDLAEGASRFLSEERELLQYTLQKTRSLSGQYERHADFALQRSMWAFTKWAVAVSIASFIVAIMALGLKAG